jgi:2-dehydropantoate 2-reductase
VEVSLASRLVTGAKRLFERNKREVPVLSLKMLEESAAVATACGHQPSEAVLARHAAAMTEPGSSLTYSMYRDLRKGAPVEADHILGDFIERGVATPLLKAAFVNLRIYQAGLPKP